MHTIPRRWMCMRMKTNHSEPSIQQCLAYQSSIWFVEDKRAVSSMISHIQQILRQLLMRTPSSHGDFCCEKTSESQSEKRGLWQNSVPASDDASKGHLSVTPVHSSWSRLFVTETNMLLHLLRLREFAYHVSSQEAGSVKDSEKIPGFRPVTNMSFICSRENKL